MQATLWNEEEGKLVRTFQFETFKEALSFINKVGEIAEDINHHPEIWNTYNVVRLSLSTHEANAITEKDYNLAELIDML